MWFFLVLIAKQLWIPLFKPILLEFFASKITSEKKGSFWVLGPCSDHKTLLQYCYDYIGCSRRKFQFLKYLKYACRPLIPWPRPHNTNSVEDWCGGYIVPVKYCGKHKYLWMSWELLVTNMAITYPTWTIIIQTLLLWSENDNTQMHNFVIDTPMKSASWNG